MIKEKSMIIIGAGLAGLAAGCYAQMNGYKSKILEMHTLPGGACTSWKRGEYIFDWCIQWMLGSSPGNEMNQIWKELGALQGKSVHHPEIFNYIESPEGKQLKFYVDPDRLEAHLKELSPLDEKPIRRFCRELKSFSEIIELYPFLTPMPLMGFREKMKMLSGFRKHLKLIKSSHNTLLVDFIREFKDPFMRKAFIYPLFQQQMHFPLLPYYFNLGCATRRNAGCPEGGSLGLAESIATRYESLGGEILYKAKVKKIITENNYAVGVELDNGTKLHADIILSACDMKQTIDKLLSGRYKNKLVNKLYKELIDQPDVIFPGQVSLFLGVDRDMSDFPHSITYLLNDKQANKLPSAIQKNLVIDIRTNRFPDMAPQGKSVIYAWYFSDFNYWNRLKSDKNKYQAEKQKVFDFVMDFLEEKYPGIGSQVEKKDISTPTTLKRYTNVYKGSVLGWNPFYKAEDHVERLIKKHKMKLPGLKNFYISGQWTTTIGGLIRAVSTGRHAIQFVCKDEKKIFKAIVPEKIYV